MQIESWTGCYAARWTGLLSDEARQHPAKMALGLATRIAIEVKQMLDMKRQPLVLDPFGGIGSTGYVCSWNGMDSLSVELEPRWYQATVGHDCYPGSPCVSCAEDGGSKYSHRVIGTWERHFATWLACGCPLPKMVLGSSVDLVPFLEPGSVDAVISSPPYGAANSNPGKPKAGWYSSGLTTAHGAGGALSERYGGSQGQVASERMYKPDWESPRGFWVPVLKILQAVYDAMRPGGVAVCVTKDYVSKGERQPFSQWWVDACSRVGFSLERHVHAMLVRVEAGPGLFDEEVKVRKGGRKTALKRIHDRKLDQDDKRWIDHEDVLFLRK